MGKVKYEKTVKSMRKAWSKYAKANTKAFTFRLNYKSDGKLIEYLSSLPNKAQVFRTLFTEYMNKSDRD